MYRHTIHLIVLLAGLSFTACGGGNQGSHSEDPVAGQHAAEEQKWDEVMVVHDEVMPKMSEINRISRALRQRLDEENSIPSDLRQQAEQAVQQLTVAEEAMWEWMNNIRQLDALRESKNHEEIIQYLDDEQARISKVRDAMLSSIESGEKVLNQIQSDHGEQ